MTRVNSTVALTLILLSLVVAAGVVSAAWGYALGREALKGITQPDARPSRALGGDTAGAPRREEVTILKEEDILADVKARMEGRTRSVAAASPVSSQAVSPSPSSSAIAASPDATTNATPTESILASPQAGLPIVGQDQGVTLEVRSVHQQDGALVMDVSLQNTGSRPVKFLYSFMNITDNQGRSFSANTEGLPGELPPNSEPFSGTVSVPTALLEDSNNLSLALTDYPEQQLKLRLSGIPVMR